MTVESVPVWTCVRLLFINYKNILAQLEHSKEKLKYIYRIFDILCRNHSKVYRVSDRLKIFNGTDFAGMLAEVANTWMRMWTVDRGQWIVDCGPWTVEHGLGTVDQGSRTEDRGWWIMDQGLWNKDRGPRTEDQRPRTECGHQELALKLNNIM